jgi:hypothetical protein
VQIYLWSIISYYGPVYFVIHAFWNARKSWKLCFTLSTQGNYAYILNEFKSSLGLALWRLKTHKVIMTDRYILDVVKFLSLCKVNFSCLVVLFSKFLFLLFQKIVIQLNFSLQIRLIEILFCILTVIFRSLIFCLL